MLVLSNEAIDGLVSMRDCMDVLEPMYRDLAAGRALLSPRVDNISPSAHPGAYYAFKQMGGTWPARGIQALILEKARAAGIGEQLPDDWFSEDVHP